MAEPLEVPAVTPHPFPAWTTDRWVSQGIVLHEVEDFGGGTVRTIAAYPAMSPQTRDNRLYFNRGDWAPSREKAVAQVRRKAKSRLFKLRLEAQNVNEALARVLAAERAAAAVAWGEAFEAAPRAGSGA